MPRRVFQFGTFSLDPGTGELTSGGAPVRVRGQAVELLTALLERPGDLVTRQELATRLWPPGTFVDSDRGLNKAINHLREALGDSSEAPQYVETLPRKGYRFIAPVTVVANEDVGLPDSAHPVALKVVSTPRPKAAWGGRRRIIWLAVAAAAALLGPCRGRHRSSADPPPATVGRTAVDRVDRGAPAREPLERSGSGVLRRRDDRRAHHGPRQGRRAARDVTHLGDALQGHVEVHPRRRTRTGRRCHRRRHRRARRRPCAHQRRSSSRSRRTRTSGRRPTNAI